MAQKRIWATSEDGTIEYSSLTAERLEETIIMMREALFQHENICIALGIPGDIESILDCEKYLYDYAEDGVSVIAIDKVTGNVIGAFFNKIYTVGTPSAYLKYVSKAKYPSSKAFYQLLTEIEEKYDFYKEFNVDCIFELGTIGVLPTYTGRKIGYKLSEISFALATKLYHGENVTCSLDGSERKLDYVPKLCTTFLTSLKSQRIMQKLGFQIVSRINYDDVYYQGKSYSSIIGKETPEMITEYRDLR